ncbi:AraC family transcriptional regulator [Hydrogenophaga crassostreae]|uniref:AraC family transcriptional regulator n=1 Tax=Hydrogenophaga crassostreae TaxID=1763535 RepID=A0A167HA37_9BURK|nr:AraC family transcriptional regulator [Hydrogenophaga crassostreae]AOW12704.1 AraC family transcriptional regulator [Hydrogenophaga crassostreae]OAD40576.1 AraC family transcriptional regulator [Hydrogenophaga crassostreae]
MLDPLAEVVALLEPRAPFSKRVGGAGAWRVRRAETGQPFYCVVLEGSCWLTADGNEPVALDQGDFALIPAACGFAMTSHPPQASTDALETPPVMRPDGEVRLGVPSGPPDVRMLIGHCVFGSPDAALLVSLLPQLVVVRGEQRLATLVQLVREESRAQRPARDVILERLLEVLLIEALRSSEGTAAPPGLVRALADERLARAIRHMHENPAAPWTVAQLAQEAALSRSAFFERFNRAVGVPPMEYLMRWRMALAKNLLRDHKKAGGMADIAEQVGYGSASAFSVAFTRHVGLPPSQYTRAHANLRNA